MLCWHLKIPNLVYVEHGEATSLEEQLEFADKLEINLSIIIKEKVIYWVQAPKILKHFFLIWLA